MTLAIWFFAAIFIYIAIFFILQIGLFQAVRVRELILTFSLIAFLTAFIVWIPYYFLSADLLPDPVVRGLVAFAGAYGSLGFAGIYIILGPISSDRSLSAHLHIMMLREGGQMSEAEILRRYNQDVIWGKRFDEYLYVGAMTKSDGKWHLTRKGRRIAYTFLIFLKALKMKENF